MARMIRQVDLPDEYLVERAERVEHVRGLLLGLAMGEAFEYRHQDLVPAPTGTQLACATVDGMIRAISRDTSDQAQVLQNSLHRWAHGRGYHRDAIERAFEDTLGSLDWNKGWITHAGPMRRDLGTSPTTVQALGRSAKDRFRRDLPNQSDGYQSLLRTFPLGLHPVQNHGDPREHVKKALHLTHGGSRALQASLVAFDLVQSGLRGAGRMDFEDHARKTGLTFEGQSLRSQAVLGQLALAVDALSVLHASLYVAQSFPQPEDFWEALEFCQVDRPQAKAVAAAAGVLLGFTHGGAITDAWQFRPLEIGWVADALAHDLITEIDEHPGYGKEGISCRDPWWNEKYPVY